MTGYLVKNIYLLQFVGDAGSPGLIGYNVVQQLEAQEQPTWLLKTNPCAILTYGTNKHLSIRIPATAASRS